MCVCVCGGGGGVLPYTGYIGMCRCEGYGFQAVYSWMVEDFSLDYGNGELPLKNMKNQIGIVLPGLCQLLWDGGYFGSLV